MSYGLGFLAYVPIPFLNFIIAGVAMALSYRTQRHKSPLAEENSRRAANWGLTLITIVLAGLALTFLGVWIVVATTPDGERQSAWPAIILVAVLFGCALFHLIVIASGVSQANKRQIVAALPSITFIKPPKDALSAQQQPSAGE